MSTSIVCYVCCSVCKSFSNMFEISYLLFFFFKQKTAYEMRISDWSSDVCSSDLYSWATTARFAFLGLALLWSLRLVWRLTGLRTESPWRREIGRASCRERVCQYV